MLLTVYFVNYSNFEFRKKVFHLPNIASDFFGDLVFHWGDFFGSEMSTIPIQKKLAQSKQVFNLFEKGGLAFEAVSAMDSGQSGVGKLLSDELVFRREFTIFVTGKLSNYNGDLFGVGDCFKRRFLVHAPFDKQIFVMFGDPNSNVVKFSVLEEEKNAFFALVISRSSFGSFKAGFNDRVQWGRIGEPFNDEFSGDLVLATSACQNTFKGKVYRFGIIEAGLSEMDILALLGVLRSQRVTSCNYANVVDCLL